eukprot:2729696-Prorocentrum_lima.AAC.1
MNLKDLARDDPIGPERDLGCNHRIKEASTAWHEQRPSQDEEKKGHPRHKVRIVEYNIHGVHALTC